MAEMTDAEVHERLDKYRSGRKARKIGVVAGIIAAVAIVVAGIAYGSARAERNRIAILEQKPLREWTEQEQAKYQDLYQKRLKSEPIDWRGIFKTGVYSPIGKTTIKGVWIKKAIILFAFLTVLTWLLIAIGIHIPLIWHMAYICSSILTIFLLYILALHFWRLLVQ